MKLLLPVPPSVNELYSPRKGGGQRKSDAYVKWIRHAGQFYMLEKRKLEPVRGPYTVTLRVPEKTRADADNLLKATLDFLKTVGLTDDDRHCVRATAEKVRELTLYAEVEAVPA